MGNDINGGITTRDIVATLQSNPAEAARLGEYFRASQQTRLVTSNLGTYDVDGHEAVNYGRTGTGDVAKYMQPGPVMVGDSEYAIGAGGQIDKNAQGWWSSMVSPGDNAQDGRTRLQVAVVRDGEVLRTENFRPDADGQMRIRTRPGEEGARMGFYMLDGSNNAERTDNAGQFKVSVDETRRVQTTTAIGIQATDAEGIVAAGEQVARQFETAPEAASIPAPDWSLACAEPGTGIIRDPGNNELTTTDGYRFQFDENKVSIYAPGRGEAVSTFDGRNVTESDGTAWRAETGNFIAPNGALLRLEYDGESLKRAELIHGDTRVNVKGPGPADGAVQLGEATGGGFARRQELVEGSATDRTYRLGGFFDRKDDLDITWNQEEVGRHQGVVADGHDPSRGRIALEDFPYVIDPAMKLAFGTEDYERMLNSEIRDLHSNLSGLGIADGVPANESRVIADYLLGPASGQYEAYAKELEASRAHREDGRDSLQLPAETQQFLQQYMEQQLMQQVLGGLPQQFESFPAAMQALQQLVAVLAAQAAMQNDFQQGASNLRSYIPSVGAAQQNQVSADALVDHALRGLNNRTQRDPLARFDLNTGRDYAARRVGRDPAAALIARRMQETGRTEAQKPQADLETRATQLAMGIHDAIDGAGTKNEKLAELLSKATPEERAAMRPIYEKLFGESVENAIKGDTSWWENLSSDHQNSVLGLLNNTSSTTDVRVDDAKATNDAKEINDAIRSDWYNPSTWGTDTDKLTNILTNRSPAEIKRISEIYQASYGESLRDAIIGDTQGDPNYQKTLLAQLDRAEGERPVVIQRNPAEVEANQAALAINNAVHGIGTDNQKLIDVLSSMSNEGKAKLREVYPKLYGESLESAIKNDTNDHWDLDFQNHLLALAGNNRSTATTANELTATQNAAKFRAAVTTWDGTDEATLDRLMTTLSPAEIKAMARVYETTYGESLSAAISGDTSGWHETALLHQLNNLK